MGIFQKFKTGLARTRTRLGQEIQRIISRSPKLSAEDFEDIEAVLLGADLGLSMTERIVRSIREAYESQGRDGLDVAALVRREIETSLKRAEAPLRGAEKGLTVISMVGVNGTGKTTTAAKLAHRLQGQGKRVMLAACDTFRAAAIEQLKVWGDRLNVPVISGAYGADPASVGHDAVSAALARDVEFLVIDTAGRLHTKSNLMQELQKLHRVIKKQLPDAPHEVLLVLDGTTGMNALIQAREFHKSVNLSGLIITKLDGTSKGGMAVAIQEELELPIHFIGLGEGQDDLHRFSARDFAHALMPEPSE